MTSGRFLPSTLFVWLVALLATVLVSGCGQSQTENHAAGPSAVAGYVIVKQPDDALAGQEQIHLVEFFWYGCPHCNAFRDYFQPWLQEQGGQVQHIAVPVGLKPEWIDHARAYYAARALNELPRFHNAFYDAIHVQEMDLDLAQQIVPFVRTLGIDAEAFARIMNAEATEQAILADGELARRYGVNTTPTLVLNGKYLVSPPTAGGYDAMLAVIDDLIEQRGTMARKAE